MLRGLGSGHLGAGRKYSPAKATVRSTQVSVPTLSVHVTDNKMIDHRYYERSRRSSSFKLHLSLFGSSVGETP